jgi:hypothetical protein
MKLINDAFMFRMPPSRTRSPFRNMIQFRTAAKMTKELQPKGANMPPTTRFGNEIFESNLMNDELDASSINVNVKHPCLPARQIFPTMS